MHDGGGAIAGLHPDERRMRTIRQLIGAAAGELGCTPWKLDHAVWQAQRARRSAGSSDSATTRRYRAQQGRWRETELALPAGAPTSARTTAATVESMLPAAHDGVRAKDAGWNLMSPAAVEYAQARVPVIKAAQGVVETDRLWRNMLSSQPLAFSIVGELRPPSFTEVDDTRGVIFE